MSAADTVTAFLEAMRSAGIEPAEPINHQLAAGERVRFQCVGDTKGRRNGWARLYFDGRPAGAFGTYRGGLQVTWRADVTAPSMSPEDRAAARAAQAEEKAARAAERTARHDAVAIEAEAMLAAASPATAHSYLARKRISGEGLFVAGVALLVPMRDTAGKLWNVQRIYPDGGKFYLKGGRVEGVFWHAGQDNGPLCIGEGVGTMAAVRRATGHAVVATMTAANLEPVARALRQLWPDRPMIICADDDAHLINHPQVRRNIGLDAARAAAAAIGASVALPPRSSLNG